MRTNGAQPDPVELDKILEKAITTVQGTYPEATIQADLGADVDIYQPEDMVRIMVEELLKNGIKHTESDKLLVTIKSSNPQPSVVSIAVTDQGPGIAEEEKQVLSKRKEQPLMHSEGFGLWEVNWLVSGMDGELTLEENDPYGTIATIKFPTNQNET